MNAPLVIQSALAWALTYALHSTALLLLAWLVTRVLSSERLRLRELIWKTALVGGLASAGLQLGLDVAPLGGRLDVGRPASLWSVASPIAAPATAFSAGTAEALEFDWQRLALGVWALGGALGLFLLVLAWRRIADLFHGRRRVPRGPTRELLKALSQRAGLARAPRLTASSRLRSPATIGVFLPQICVPYRALRELTLDQQQALLAHELAHIVRRDPLWFFVCRLIERALFFQPLNRMARVELEELAEFLADDWAVEVTRDELSLARCLAEVATWVLGPRPVVALVPMASNGSRLEARVDRLLDAERRAQVHGPRPALVLGCGLALGLVVLAAPGAAGLPQAPLVSKTGGAPSAMPAGLPSLQPRLVPPAARAPRAPQAPPAGVPNLDALLERLDAVVVELADEVEALGRELRDRPLSAIDARLASDLQRRVRSLQERRARLHQIMPELQRRLSPRSASKTPNSNPLQEGIR